MKSKKGEQVFTENTDDILADKIIDHTEMNSKKYAHKGKLDDNTQNRNSLKKYITIALGALTSILLLFILTNGLRKK